MDSDEDNFISYGTPLESYEEDDIPSKKKCHQSVDQYAFDAHGIRRFHGAFTGGFSAGYGNSVGTPEGWTPSRFKSSRSEKATIQKQKPEDYMDEEDRSEFGIAPRQVQTQSEFSGQKRSRQQFHDGPIPGQPVLEQLVRAVHETAAVRMLRSMGWRDGQGTGERLTRLKKKQAKEQHKIYGCYVPPEMRQNDKSQSEESSDSEFEYDTLFAPDDYDLCGLRHKNDRFGLGYSGLSRHSVLGNLTGEYGNQKETRSHLVMKDKGKRVSIRGQAFGVGAFEAEDEDIYATQDMSHYDRSIGGAPDVAPSKPAKKNNSHVLEGFVKANQPYTPAPVHPPPAVPRDYVPAPAGHRRSRFEPTAHLPRDQGLGRHELTADARGALLGETPLPNLMVQGSSPQVNKSDQIVKGLERNVSFVSTSTIIDNNEESNKELDFISIKDSGKELNKVFKPFVSDPKKQARYERYLKNKESVETEGSSTDVLSEWERQREIIEFEQAAKLYKPLTGVMGDRFTHAAEPDAGALNPLCAVAKSLSYAGLVTPEQIEAAKQGLYGAATRSQTPWRPESIVCKRFNVPEPGVVGSEKNNQDKSKVSYSVFSYLESSIHDKNSFAKEQTKFSGSKSLDLLTGPKNCEKTGPKQSVNVNKEVHIPHKVSTNEMDTDFNKRITVAELFLQESEKALQNKASSAELGDTINKFDKMDLYKSIFLSDSENEESSVSAENQVESKNTIVNEFVEIPKNVERNLSPPRGIFANIDFDELNSWKRDSDKRTQNSALATVTKESEVNKDFNLENTNSEKPTESVKDDFYGPRIPDELKKRLEVPSLNNLMEKTINFKPLFRDKHEREKHISTSSSSDSWVDVKDLKPKKQKNKKSKKHKNKHKKHKRKKTDK